jgi:hypothetical protein
MTSERNQQFGDPVTVEGRDRSPRGAWRWAIAAAFVPLMIGFFLMWYGSGRAASSTLAPQSHEQGCG